MIIYKTIKTQEDLEKVKDLCKKNNMTLPINNEVIFGAFDGDKIVGCSVLRKEYLISHLINETNHGHVFSVLFEKAFACASIMTNKIIALVKDKNIVELYKKGGAHLIEENIYYMKKDI